MFYRVDSVKISIREYWWDCKAPWKWPILFIGVLLKLFRIRLPGTSDDTTVDKLGPYRVSEADLEPGVLEKLLPLENELADKGFHSPIYHAIDNTYQLTTYRYSTLVSDAGDAFARIHFRLWSYTKPAKEYLYLEYVSQFTDGSFLITTSGKADMLPPPNCRVCRHMGAKTADLWAAHRKALQEEQLTKNLVKVGGQVELLSAIESLHESHVQFHVERGVFVPLTAEEEEKGKQRGKKKVDESGMPTAIVDANDRSVLEEINDRLEGKRSWGSGIIILVVSLLLFLSLGSFVWSWDFVLMLIPILLIHEMGHFLAMRVFKYRNVRMFFIPLMGAAVTGQSFNVPAWKRVVVSLMGPLPGIALAVGVGIASLFVEYEWVGSLAFLMLVINGFNLIPVLPLDGGWVVHALFFSRNGILDIAFRVLAAGSLFVVGSLSGDRLLMGLGIFSAVGIPWAIRLNKITKKLREENFQAASYDDQTVPEDVALKIIREVRDCSPSGLNAKNTAMLSLQVFEALHAKPPGWLATIFLAGVHASSFIAACVLAMIFVIAQQGSLSDFLMAAVNQPTRTIRIEEIEEYEGEIVANEEVAIIVGHCATHEDALQVYLNATPKLTDEQDALLFGASVMIICKASDNETREKWLTTLDTTCEEVFVANDRQTGWVSISCIAPTEEVADRIEKQLNGYYALQGQAYLVAPWTPDKEITAEQQLARETYYELVNAETPYNNPEISAMFEEQTELQRRGDEPGVEQIQQRMQDKVEEVKEIQMQEFRNSHTDQACIDVIDLYEKQPEWQYQENVDEATRLKQSEEHEKARTKWLFEIGQLMGQIPSEDSHPDPSELIYSSSGAGVSRAGLLLTINFLTFERVDYGAPAILRWLEEQECLDFKYEISSGL